MNKYDLEHATVAHDSMSREEWERAYRLAWDTYYTPEHCETVMQRAVARGISPGKILFLMTWFYGCITLERVHPLQGGYFRRKYRKDRRPGLPIENPLVFYSRYAWEILSKHVRLARMVSRMMRVRRRLKRDPKAREYTDLSLTPVSDNDYETLEIFNVTDAAVATVQKVRQRQQKKAVAPGN
jgi:hypothetical protein